MSEQSHLIGRQAESTLDAVREGYSATGSAFEDASGRSIGTIMGDLTRDLSTLMRQEVALAKAEVRQSGAQAGRGVGLLVGALLAGQLFLVFLSVCVWWALGLIIGNQWSALVVAGVWLIISVVLVSMGRRELQRVRGLSQTTESLKKVPNALKGQEEANQ